MKMNNKKESLDQEIVKNFILEELSSANKDKVVKFLKLQPGGQFFLSPSSKMMIAPFEGGLATQAATVFLLAEELLSTETTGIFAKNSIDIESQLRKSLWICLVHDIYKYNAYISFYKNVKVGNDWVRELCWKDNDISKLCLFGYTEATVWMLSQLGETLTSEEGIALRYASIRGDDAAHQRFILEAQRVYPLVRILRMAKSRAELINPDLETVAKLITERKARMENLAQKEMEECPMGANSLTLECRNPVPLHLQNQNSEDSVSQKVSYLFDPKCHSDIQFNGEVLSKSEAGSSEILFQKEEFNPSDLEPFRLPDYVSDSVDLLKELV